MREYKIRKTDAKRIINQKLFILVIPCALIGTSIALFQYIERLIETGNLSLVVLLVILTISCSVTIGYIVFLQKLTGTSYLLDNSTLTHRTNNGITTIIDFNENPIIKKSKFGMIISIKQRKISIPSVLGCYEEIVEKINNFKD